MVGLSDYGVGVADPFHQPEIADLWESTADIVGDASVARQVIEHLAVGFWNLNWETWENLLKSVDQ